MHGLHITTVLFVVCACAMLVTSQHAHFSTGWSPGFGIGKRGGISSSMREQPMFSGSACQEKLIQLQRMMKAVTVSAVIMLIEVIVVLSHLGLECQIMLRILFNNKGLNIYSLKSIDPFFRYEFCFYCRWNFFVFLTHVERSQWEQILSRMSMFYKTRNNSYNF